MRYFVFIFLLAIPFSSFSKTGKYRLTLRDNPATSVVIGWEQVSGENPVVYYGSEDNGTEWKKYKRNAKPDRLVQYAEMENCFVRLNGLSPNTAYYFVIKDSEGVCQRFWFKTAPMESNSRMSFIAGGDSRNNPIPRRNANLLVSKLKPHAVLFGGDMTVSGTPEQWQAWFEDWQYTISEDGRMYPIIAARGNHEGNNEMIYHLFDVPSEKIYYGVTCGDDLVRVYVLNTEISIAGEQTNWLINDLEVHKKSRWKIAQYHKPMRPHVSRKREGNGQYMEWAKLFYDEKVKLVVECDAHTVKTTWPVKPSTKGDSDEGFVRDDRKGTVYVGEGCWGAPLRPSDDPKSWTRDHGMFNQFKWIFMDKKQIEVRTIKVDNAEEVSSVSNDNPFAIPENLDVWNPENGSVVTIRR
ncbi:purple acid phosphatase family protein [Draconibacterium halophilum]|uniref:Metallophosphoesterase family protein n=1 Tax=Draconibacterium halophilum TaxID=2706887 RepID=A0A6C0R8A4_9BACT|nr:metallophosphoesterase family protein [Draconibacterium halophilum]QIA06480.1 metallophosphoesterase family protein [Draconibacterium halophilum]